MKKIESPNENVTNSINGKVKKVSIIITKPKRPNELTGPKPLPGTGDGSGIIAHEEILI